MTDLDFNKGQLTKHLKAAIDSDRDPRFVFARVLGVLGAYGLVDDDTSAVALHMHEGIPAPVREWVLA